MPTTVSPDRGRTSRASRPASAPRRMGRAPSALDGPPLALAAWLDRASEAWWRLRPRGRALAIAVTTLALVATATARVVRDPNGPPTPVLVVTRDLPAGHALGAQDVRRRTWPRDLVPPGATARTEGRLAMPLVAGSVLTDAHLDDAGPASGLGPGAVAVPVPAELLPELDVGDRVDVLTAAGDGSGIVVANDAVVTAADTVTVWLAVDRRAAAGIVAAVLRGAVGVALLSD